MKQQTAEYQRKRYEERRAQGDVTISLWVGPVEFAKLKRMAEAINRPIRFLVRRAIEEFLEKLDE